jgi:hypothetical protein
VAMARLARVILATAGGRRHGAAVRATQGGAGT